MENEILKANTILNELITKRFEGKTVDVTTEFVVINKIEWIESQINSDKLSRSKLYKEEKQEISFKGSMRITKEIEYGFRSDSLAFEGKGLIYYSNETEELVICDLDNISFNR